MEFRAGRGSMACVAKEGAAWEASQATGMDPPARRRTASARIPASAIDIEPGSGMAVAAFELETTK